MSIQLITPLRFINSKKCYPRKPVGARFGVMWHFDDSHTDDGAESWFRHPKCNVSYNRLYLDDGTVIQITASMEEAAWHAGACKTSNANRKFYGLAAATNNTTPATKKQFDAMCLDTAALFMLNEWPASDVIKRIVGHDQEAVFASGRLGRKVDPTGVDEHGRLRVENPILSVHEGRQRVRALLEAAS